MIKYFYFLFSVYLKLKFSKPYIFATQRPQTFKTVNCVISNNQSLKYQFHYEDSKKKGVENLILWQRLNHNSIKVMTKVS